MPPIETAFSTLEMFRLSRSKDIVDICANTLRGYNLNGLPFYRHGRAVFVSRTELNEYIRDPSVFKKRIAPAPPATNGKHKRSARHNQKIPP
jgi:hypothetical protein